MSTPLKPYVAAEARQAEFTWRAVLLGVVLSVLFNAANAYVGLRIGLTVSASIPSAVLSMALLKRVVPRLTQWLFRRTSAPGTILENNIVHTIASAGESLAAGVIFTLPALYFLTRDGTGHGALPSVWETFVFGAIGGVMGIMLMVPLRRQLTVTEHATLPFPEGTACAQVLIAGDRGGADAKPVFGGVLLGAAGKLCAAGLGLWRETVMVTATGFHKAMVGFESTPLLVGVGYLVGLRIAAVMLAGALLANVGLLPLIDWLGGPGVAAMSGAEIRSGYVKYIGAGGVVFGGVVGLGRALGAHVAGVRGHAARGDVGRRRLGVAPALRFATREEGERTECDVSRRVRWGLLALAVGALACVPAMRAMGGWLALGLALLALAFAWFFVGVSGRTVGLVGTTSQPVSGMTIAVVLASALVMVALGRSGLDGQVAAMTLGAVVCIAVCLSGDLAQDLKAAALIGATPRLVQYAELIGALVAAARAGAILAVLHGAYTLGSAQLAAPQAELMAKLVRGATAGNLPWTLLGVGAAIGAAMELCGVSALAFSIGLYLPISTWSTVFVGGLMAALGKRTRDADGHGARATLFASGMVAGDALMGIAIAMAVVALGTRGLHLPWFDFGDAAGGWLGLVALLGFAAMLFRAGFGRTAEG